MQGGASTGSPGDGLHLATNAGDAGRAWVRAVDWFVPPAVHRQGAEALQRSRLAIGLAAIISTGFLVIGLTETLVGTRLVGAVFLACTGLVLLAPPLLKLTGRPALACHLLLFSIFSLLSALTIATGGQALGVLSASCTVPLAAGLLGGKRSGVFWTFLMVSVVAGVAVAARLGADFPVQPTDEVVAVAKFRGAIALTIAVLVATRTYESIKNRAVRDFARAYEHAQAEQRKRAESEQALRESEKRYRTFFTNAIVCIYEIDLNGRFLSMNPAGLRVLGAKREEEVVGTRYLPGVSPDDRSRVAALLREGYRGQVCEFEFTAILEGGPRVFASSFTPLRGEDGAVTKLIGHSTDVTERRRAEEGLRRSERKYHDLYENAPDMFVSVDVATATIQECNRTLADALGYTKDQLLGRPVLDIYHPDCRAAVDEAFRWFERTGEVEGQGLRLLRSDGTAIDVSLKVSVVRDHEGLVLYSRTAFRDVSEEIRAAEALRSSEERLAMALDATSEGVWDWNVVTDEVSFSPTWFESLGYESGEFPNQLETSQALVHPEDVPRARRELEAHFEGRTHLFECENRLRMKSGEWRPNLVRGRVVRRDEAGRPLRMVGVDIDITERRRAENALRQSKKLESLGIIAGGIAHDFNNLLVGILGNAELAAMELPAHSPAIESVAAITEASQQAAGLTEQLLVYAGKGELRIEGLDLSTLVEDTVQLVRSSLPRGVGVEYEPAKDPAGINADATQIRQVMMNLLINAAEALGEGAGTIRVHSGVMRAGRAYLSGCYVGDGLPEGDYAFTEIEDDGCGMDAETLAQIFDPFFTTKSVGRGLGLASALGTVRGHGGTIRVDSEPDRGTTFRLLFPCTREVQPAKEIRRAARVATGGTVLIVDDDATVLSVAQRMLSHCGFDTVTAGGGTSAIRRVREPSNAISAVMLDLTMPEMDGEATFRELRRIRPELPVLFFSGHSAEDGASITIGREKTAFLSKPFKLADLSEKLSELLGAESAGS